MLKKFAILAIALLACVADLAAQDQSQNSGVRRRDADGQGAQRGNTVSERAQSHYGANGSISDADVQWMRVIYRQLDLNDDKNAPLYFPEEPIDDQENLFRIIMRLLADGDVTAYEYLDGREIFTDKYAVKMSDVCERFHIPFAPAKGGSEKNPKYTIDENDVPTNEVLSYYIVERWEYDTRNNRMRSNVEAICPVLHRVGDFGGDAVKYPMFWVKFSDLRPYLAQQQIFVSDDNNLPTCNYDDFFNLSMYKGDIYKTRNLKNRSLMQMYPDPEDLKRAQDSIQAVLDNFETKLWVPDREELLAMNEEKEEQAEAKADEAGDLDNVVARPADDAAEAPAAAPAAPASDEKKSVRSTARSKKSDNGNKSSKNSKKNTKKPKLSKPQTTSCSAARSVRRKK